MITTFQHLPVLLQEVVTALDPRPGGCYIDGTVGGGGHALALLEASAPKGRLLGIDADPTALAATNLRFAAAGIDPQRFTLHHAAFRNLSQAAHQYGLVAVDGILLDLGVSSYQFDTASRGFSFAHDGPLDMRLDPTAGTTAADLVNQLDERDLADLIYQYGEERSSRRIAHQIVVRRKQEPFTRTADLANLIARTLGRPGRDRIHPATRTFQALRIVVNAELDQLEEVLPQAVELLREGGRIAVISFHSLEDRIVKNFFRAESGYGGSANLRPPRLRILTKKPLEATPEELVRNPRARSAKLRVAERIESVG